MFKKLKEVSLLTLTGPGLFEGAWPPVREREGKRKVADPLKMAAAFNSTTVQHLRIRFSGQANNRNLTNWMWFIKHACNVITTSQ